MAIDAETAELIQILRNSTRTPGSVFDRAATRMLELMQDNAEMLALTERFDAHPEDYDGPCNCQECQGDTDDGPEQVAANVVMA